MSTHSSSFDKFAIVSYWLVTQLEKLLLLTGNCMMYVPEVFVLALCDRSALG